MTDRVNAFVVVLDKNIRVDDIEHLEMALRMIRGVLSVVPHVADIADHIAEERAAKAQKDRILRVLDQLIKEE